MYFLFAELFAAVVSKALIVVMPMAFQSVTGSAQFRYTTSLTAVWDKGLMAILVPSMGLEKARSLKQLGELQLKRRSKCEDLAVNTGFRTRQTWKIMSTSDPIHCHQQSFKEPAMTLKNPAFYQ